jgi:DNA polymerase III subunit alpha
MFLHDPLIYIKRNVSRFIHLHNHTHYSLLDGASTVQTLVDAAAANNMPAVALTDHGVMFGAIEFYKKATKKKIKPIIGCEVYIVTRGSRFDKSPMTKDTGNDTIKGEGKAKGRGVYHHLILLAKNDLGYKNLIKLVTLGHTEGFYYKPRIDFDLLSKNHEGIIALTACAGGVVAAPLINDQYDEALAVAKMYHELFGDDFYLELQDHGIAEEKKMLAGLPKIAREIGAKLVATNDVHYIKQAHAIAHNIMLLIPDASASNAPDISNLRYGTDQLYFKSEDEMIALFADYPEAIASTLEIADKCHVEFDMKTNFMPQFPIPPDAGVETLDDYFEKLSWEGLHKRFSVITPEIDARHRHELGVIRKMGYSGYFLITADFIRAARKLGCMVGPGRGSAAGSLVSYALGITNVDPLKYDLLFERFLNPERISMPDIDVDFSDEKRGQVIEYVRNRYGADSVSQIITFGTLSSKAVLKDVGRVLGIELPTINEMTKVIPTSGGKVMHLKEAFETIEELKPFKKDPNPKIKQLIDVSLVLEGMNRNASMHAAGVVIAPAAIHNFVPMYKTPSSDLMTQFTMKDLEDAGLLKMDFLGLRTLTVIENALDLIKRNHGITIDLDTIPENDAKTFDLFGKGQTVAVFQFESSGMQEWLRKLRPTCISDLVAMNALYRPGPMDNIGNFINCKHGLAKIEYLHPGLEGSLKETYGVIVYQEQVMRIVSDLAGFSLAKADLMRRAMGKKDPATMQALKGEFVEGAKQKDGTPAKIAEQIFDLILKFAAYGFNKSHSVAYSVVAYHTAYLKAHYPAEYMAATLTSEINNTDKIVLFIDDCRKLGIEVLPPDVNESEAKFNVTKEGIRFGLAAIKGVGSTAVESMITARAGKPFTSLFDFCRRVDLRTANKKTIEALIQAGAFDSFTKNRAQLFEAVEQCIQTAQRAQMNEEKGQDSLFAGVSTEGAARSHEEPTLPAAAMWTESKKLLLEKDVLGFYVSGHPLRRYQTEIDAFVTVRLGDVEELKNGTVRAVGVITSMKKIIDKRGKTMAFITIEDFTGKAEVIVFSSVYKDVQNILVDDAMVMVEGNGEVSGDTIKILANEILPMEEVRTKLAKKMFFRVDADSVTEEALLKLKTVFGEHKGACNCYFNVTGKDFPVERVYLSRKFSVNPTNEFVDDVQTILGKHSIIVST